MTESVLTEKKLRQSAQWQGWLGWFAFAAAVGASDTVRPAGFAEPSLGGFVVWEHPHQFERGDALAEGFAGSAHRSPRCGRLMLYRNNDR